MNKRFLTSLIFILAFVLIPVMVCAQPAGVIEKKETEVSEAKPVEVFFSKEISSRAALALYEKLNFKPRGKLAVKVHFGEKGNKNFLRPELVEALVKKVNGTLVETSTIYGDTRSIPENHVKLAKEHGWGFAPIHILDRDGEVTFDYKGRYFDKIFVGKDMDSYPSFLVISHFKGHKMNGVGGALKNLAMGFGSPKGKKAMHFKQIPEIDKNECVKCGLCAASCPAKAINKDIVIDKKKCIGCGKCISVCPVKAIKSSSLFDRGHDFQKKVAEYATAISKRYHATYINFLNNISPSCDCISHAEAPFTGDIGILASNDPVALDQACYDLVNHQCKTEDAFRKHSKVSGLPGINHAEKLGAGTRKYKLVKVEFDK